MKDWHVDTSTTLSADGLAETLNDLDAQDHSIDEMVPHQAKRLDGPGREVGVDVISTTSDESSAHYDWEVWEAEGYGPFLQALLQKAEDTGWDKFQIIPSRQGTKTFPYLVVRKPR